MKAAPGWPAAGAEDALLDLLYARWRGQAVHAGVKLGLFEAAGHSARPASDIARELGLDAASCYRLLRALASLGLLRAQGDREFSLTAAGEQLRGSHARSMRDIFLLREGPEHTAVWKHLPDIVRDGRQDGFVREFGAQAFDYARNTPAYRSAFDAGMSGHSRLQTQWVIEALREVEFSGVGQACDIGGGQGHLLCHLLIEHPHMAGTVLDRAEAFESPHGLWAGRLGLESRCRYQAGDMFADVPRADAYFLKMILHDWNDEECLRILANARRRAAPRARVFIVEHVIAQSTQGQYAALFDLHMMCWGPGRERTEREYEELLRAAGWEPVANRYPHGGIIGVIEGARAAP